MGNLWDEIENKLLDMITGSLEGEGEGNVEAAGYAIQVLREFEETKKVVLEGELVAAQITQTYEAKDYEAEV